MRFGFCKGEGVHKPLQLKQTEREDEGIDHPPQPPPPMSGRKKAAAVAVRPWLVLNTAGEARVLEAGKQAIMQRTGLPARDLRILDPQLSYPSTILGRERAIVINLEHIKAIITAQEALVINSRDPAVSPFVHLLQGRLQLQRFHLHQILQNGDGSGNSNVNKAFDLEAPRSSCSSPESFANLVSSRAVDGVDEVNHEGQAKAAENLANSTGLKILPFEFIALEACLEAACSCLENEATTLENEAHPALDKLTSKISTLNLEHVRQIKSRLVAITGRVQKVRDELEHLLDDDEDMAEMYLTDKLLTQQQLSNGSPQSSQSQFSNINGKRIATKTLSVENDIQNNYDHNDLFSGSSMILGDEHGSYTFSTCSSRHLNVEELEMLLEAYFVQIDSTLNKLSALREYVDDTEDYINLMLDDKQNHLLQMGVVLMTATMIISAFIVLVAIFGMNIKVSLFDENKASTTEFWWTVGGGATGSLLLYVFTITWCKHKGLLE